MGKLKFSEDFKHILINDTAEIWTQKGFKTPGKD